MSDKKKAEAIINKINKRFGDGTIAMASKHRGAEMMRMRTGILSLDIVTGGGLVLGTLDVFYGDPKQGKSTVAMHILAERQRRGELCAYIYTEGQCDKKHLETCGVDLSKLLFTETNESEEAVDLVNVLATSGDVSFIVVDSLQGLVPSRILDVPAQQHMGVHAYFNNLMCSIYTAATSIKAHEKPWCNLALISHGAVPMGGGLMYAKGGKGQEFFAMQMFHVRAGLGVDVDGAEAKETASRVGHKIHVRVTKNKSFPPYKICDFSYFVGQSNYGPGRGDIDHVLDTVTCGVKYGIFEMAGSWINYAGQKFQGIQAFSNYLRAMSKADFEKLRDRIYSLGVLKESNLVNPEAPEEKPGGAIEVKGAEVVEQPGGQEEKKPAEGKRGRGRPRGPSSTGKRSN